MMSTLVKKNSLYTACAGLACLVLLGAGCMPGASNTSNTAQGPAGVFVSQDSGESWSQLSAFPRAEGVTQLEDVSVYRFYDDPQDSRAFYWASRGQGLYFTYDGGVNWQLAGAPLNTGFIQAVSVHPTDKCTILASNGGQVLKSDDCNRNWEIIFRETKTNVRVTGIAYNHARSNELYLVETNGAIQKSTDGGATWATVYRAQVDLDSISVDPNDANILYVATRENGLLRSFDAGATWEDPKTAKRKLSEFAQANKYRRFFVNAHNSSTLYSISKFGILKSNDNGESWNALNLLTPAGSVDIYGFAAGTKNPNELYYTATVGGRSTLYKSLDAGNTWSTTKELPSGQVPTALRVHPNRENVLYAGFTILTQ